MVVNPFSDGIIFTSKTYNLYRLYNLYISLSDNLYIEPIIPISPIDYSKVVVGGDRRNEMKKLRKDVIIDIETLTLDPLDPNARVVAIGVKCDDFDEVLVSNKEDELLERFWRLSFFDGSFRIIGFNVFNFDLPYLLIRTFKYGIRMPDIKGKTIDLRFVLSFGNKYKNGKLEDYSTLFMGKYGKKNGEGSDVETLWKEGKYEELKTYCKNDVRLTFKIFERLVKMEVLDE